VQELGDDFAPVFDDDPERDEYAVVDTLRATEVGFSLRRPLQTGGSLLLVRDFEVHPGFSGQLLGGRLLAHAVWALIRHPDDLLYLGAFRWRKLFTHDPRMLKPSAGEVAQLVRYYERFGFHRAEPEKCITRKDHVRLYRHVGTFGLPFHGLGPLSKWAGKQGVEPLEDDP
jgi:GNAT superfamily N-acetyltransferase